MKIIGMLVGLVIGVALAGCTVTKSERPPCGADTPQSNEFLADGFTIDLHKRPSLEQLGTSAGQRFCPRDLTGGKSFPAKVTFADNHVLTTRSEVLTVETSEDGVPTSIDLDTETLTVDQVHEQVRDLGPEVSLPTKDQDILVNFADASVDGQFGRRVVTAPLSGPDTLQIEIVVDRPNEFHLDFHIHLAP